MNAATARLVAVSLGLGVASTTVAAAALLLGHNPLADFLLVAKEQVLKEQVLPGVETRLSEEFPPRHAKVLAEIARLGEHPWAGVYRTAGSAPDELVIAPDAGVTLYHGSWCGSCARYVGIGKVVDAQGSSLKLRVELQESDDTWAAWFGLDDTLYLVRWGELQFAVPSWRMELFCAEFSDGATFPYAPFRTPGKAPESSSAKPSRPAGKPIVPREFEHLLLDAPISARVVALVDWRRRPELDGKDQQAYDAVYSVDVGSEQGLAVGMYLSVEGVRYAGRFSGRVESVESETGHFQLVAYEGRAWAEGLVGKTATTQPRKPPER